MEKNKDMAPVASLAALTSGWLQSGGLLYRLTDERRPQNRDEINVTMADGSRKTEDLAARAGEVLALLAAQPAEPAPKQDREMTMRDVQSDVDSLGIGFYLTRNDDSLEYLPAHQVTVVRKSAEPARADRQGVALSERDAFEVWLAGETVFSTARQLGSYISAHADIAWKAWQAARASFSRAEVEIPEGWRIASNEEGWSIVSPSGDGCFLFDNDRLHGQTMEGAAIREVFRQLCSSLVYPLAAAAAISPGGYVLVPMNITPDIENALTQELWDQQIRHNILSKLDMASIYAAMLAAAEAPNEGESK